MRRFSFPLCHVCEITIRKRRKFDQVYVYYTLLLLKSLQSRVHQNSLYRSSLGANNVLNNDLFLKKITFINGMSILNRVELAQNSL